MKQFIDGNKQVFNYSSMLQGKSSKVIGAFIRGIQLFNYATRGCALYVFTQIAKQLFLILDQIIEILHISVIITIGKPEKMYGMHILKYLLFSFLSACKITINRDCSYKNKRVFLYRERRGVSRLCNERKENAGKGVSKHGKGFLKNISKGGFMLEPPEKILFRTISMPG